MRHFKREKTADKCSWGISLNNSLPPGTFEYHRCHSSSVTAEIQGSSHHASPSRHVGGRVTQAGNSRPALMRCAVVVSVQCRSFSKHSRRRTANHHQSKDDGIARVGVWCHQRASYSDVQSNWTTETVRLYPTRVFSWILEGAQRQWEEIIYIDPLKHPHSRGLGSLALMSNGC